MIAKSKKNEDHVSNLRKLFKRLRKYQLKLNLAKCTFGVLSGKLLGFIVSQSGIEVDPDKVRAIQEMPSLLEFVAQCTQRNKQKFYANTPFINPRLQD